MKQFAKFMGRLILSIAATYVIAMALLLLIQYFPELPRG